MIFHHIPTPAASFSVDNGPSRIWRGIMAKLWCPVCGRDHVFNNITHSVEMVTEIKHSLDTATTAMPLLPR